MTLEDFAQIVDDVVLLFARELLAGVAHEPFRGYVRDVHEVGHFRKPYLDFLIAEHKTFVESSDLLECRTPDEHRIAGHGRGRIDFGAIQRTAEDRAVVAARFKPVPARALVADHHVAMRDAGAGSLERFN